MCNRDGFFNRWDKTPVWNFGDVKKRRLFNDLNAFFSMHPYLLRI